MIDFTSLELKKKELNNEKIIIISKWLNQCTAMVFYVYLHNRRSNINKHIESEKRRKKIIEDKKETINQNRLIKK